MRQQEKQEQQELDEPENTEEGKKKVGQERNVESGGRVSELKRRKKDKFEEET